MKTILLIGSGAREHAIATALKKSRHEAQLITYGETKNPGIFELSSEYYLGKVTDFEPLKAIIQKTKPDFAIAGPEAPLATGITDFLAKFDITTVGPSQSLARLESSKSFTRDLLAKYKISGNPLFQTFYDETGLAEFIKKLNGNFVVKYDGLKGGKGVKVSGEHLANFEEGLAYAKECLQDGGKVVIEEKLIGQEFSLMSFCDGQTVIDMIPVQDHKRAYENDTGPNTGGMGSYSDANHLLPFLTQTDIDQAHQITEQVIQALYKETGESYKGIAYGGFMVTKNGLKLIEYNARFGDPEAMNIFSILQTDFVDICEAIIKGTLHELKVSFANLATVCKYAVPEGYPDKPVKDEKIEIGTMGGGVNVYYASIDQRDDGLYLAGSRAVAVVGIGKTLSEAEQLAERGIEQIKGPVFHRRDIGTKELIEKRVEMMKKLRE